MALTAAAAAPSASNILVYELVLPIAVRVVGESELTLTCTCPVDDVAGRLN